MGDTRKYRNIDALRTFGCLAIIAWHVKANTGFSTGGVLDKVIPSFDYLVYLFMIISGFGMCNGYYQKLKTGTYSIDAFYSKRYKRTVPFFALLILLNCVIEFTPKTVCEGLMEITMLFGFLPNNTLSTIGVAWTLGAIFAFYIIFPFMEMYLSHMVVFRIVEKIGIMERIESPVIRYMTTYLLLVMLLVMGLTIYRKAINKLDELR